MSIKSKEETGIHQWVRMYISLVTLMKAKNENTVGDSRYGKCGISLKRITKIGVEAGVYEEWNQNKFFLFLRV